MSAVVKVWIDEGCITCDACENICPEVFHVEDDTCIIVDGVNPNEWGDDIIEAAEACPVDVILYEVAGSEEPVAEEAPAEVAEVEAPAPAAPAPAEASGDGALDAVMAGDRDLHILFGSQSGNSEDLAFQTQAKSKDFGFPVITLQKAHALVQVFPIIKKVACLLLQHSVIFGQLASWQTVLSLN